MAVVELNGAPGEVKPSVGVKIFHGLGQVAQSGGFDTALGFVFFDHSAMLGLSGTLVGAAASAVDLKQRLGRVIAKRAPVRKKNTAISDEVQLRGNKGMLILSPYFTVMQGQP